MLKRIIFAVLSTAILSSGVVAATTSPAQADQRPCVSRAEYNNMVYNWGDPTIAKVRDHFDLYGTRLAWDGAWYERDEVWSYRKCAEWGPGKVAVWYDNYTSWDGRMRLYDARPNRPWLLVNDMWYALYG